MKLSDIQSVPPKVLLWGLAGSGKTCLTTTLGDDLELINCDPNIRAALMMKDVFSPERAKVDIIANAAGDKPEYGFTRVKNRIYDIHKEIAAKTYKKKVVALDSLTTIGEFAMKSVMLNAGKLADINKLPIPTIPEWGLGIGEVENILALLISLPIPVIVIAHQLRIEIDENTKMIPWALGSKLPDKLPRMFTEIWYSKVSKTASGDKFFIQPKSTSSILARSTCLTQDEGHEQGMKALLEKVGYKL